MAAVETRIAAEGELRFVQASGFTGTFSTASAAAGKLVAFCEEVRGEFVPPEYTWMRDRGTLSHPKRTNDGGPHTVEFRCSVVNTGTLLTLAQGLGTASGASTVKVHAELKSKTLEDATLTAVYYQFHHGVLRGNTFEEGDPNVYRLRYEFWSATLATASGYLA